MANQAKVQGYLNKYRIGNLFEGMMAKLVKDMPPDPLDYLISIIQEKKEKKKSFLSETEHMDDRLNSSSVWASADRSYEKPWRAHSKKGQQKPGSPPEGYSKKEWDKTVKLTSKSFDELTLSKPTRGGTASVSKSISFAQHADGGPTSAEDTGNYITEEELLSGELLASTKKNGKATTNQPADSVSKHHPKLKGPKADSARHARELKSYLQDKRAKMEDTDSGVGIPFSDDDEENSTVVLAENSEDLAAEGVKAASGISTVKMKRSTLTSSAARAAEPLIHLSICSQCAKVVVVENADGSDGGVSVSGSSTSASTKDSSKAAKSKKSKQSTQRSDPWATHRGAESKAGFQPNLISHSSNGAGRRVTDVIPSTQRTGYSSYYDADDDEFESVSQISGDQPRIPSWAQSDDEDLSPVKGSHMLTSPRQATKPDRQRKSVTLKEDMLRKLSQSDNTVEQFLGNNTWGSGGGMSSGSRLRLHDSAADGRWKSVDFPADGRLKTDKRSSALHKSHDIRELQHSRTSYNAELSSNNTAGWRFENQSEDDSTLVS